MTALLGRAELSAHVQGLLCREDIRLVTLTGPGGVGKTRLAVDVIAGLCHDFDGVALVPLASVADPGLVPMTIARALGVGSSDEATTEALLDYLEGRTTLLVLDTVEHLLNAAPGVLDLLGAAPGLTVLVTSRTVLRVSGENVVVVPPLGLPEPGVVLSASALARFPAVQLFVDRCAAVRPGFMMSDDNAAAVVDICRGLDGLPLAIELAAARVSILPLEALLSRLKQRLTLLTIGPQDQPTRLRTLRAAIAWSYELLTPAEQSRFHRLAVFVGDFSLDAAATVLGTADGVLDAVSGLVDKSLLQPAAHCDGEPRFLMLDTIREYARERLVAAGEDTEARRAHATYFTNLAEQAESALRGPEQQRWRDALEADLNDLRSALAWTLRESGDRSDADCGLRLAGALWFFWFQRGLTGEARRWLGQALDRAPSGGRAYAQALLGVGTLAWRQGDCAAASGYLEQSVSCWRAAGEVQGLAETLHVLGHVRFDQGDYEQACGLFEESSDRFHDCADTIGGLPLAADLGMVAYHQGDHGTASRIFGESLAVYRRHGLKDRVAGVLNGLGDLARVAGENERAAELYQESLALWRELHGTPGIASALHKLGQVDRAMNNPTRARARLAESIALQQELGNKQGIAECLAALAPLADRAEHHAQILAASSALLTTIGVRLAPADQMTLTQDITAGQERLERTAWDAAWELGSALSIDEAVQVAVLSHHSAKEPVTGDGAAAEGDPDVARLSRREQEVCQLLAEGLSNREIATAMSITEKTVGSHIDHIMTKLGTRSRTRIAVWAAQQGTGRTPA